MHNVNTRNKGLYTFCYPFCFLFLNNKFLLETKGLFSYNKVIIIYLYYSSNFLVFHFFVTYKGAQATIKYKSPYSNGTPYELHVSRCIMLCLSARELCTFISRRYSFQLQQIGAHKGPFLGVPLKQMKLPCGSVASFYISRQLESA